LAQNSFSRAAGFLSCFALEWAPQSIYCRARPRPQKK
jgi:hypothetical protein